MKDAQLEELIRAADFASIDAPFGWPQSFLKFAAAQLQQTRSLDADWTPELMRELRLRATDGWIDGLHHSDQLEGPIYEVYPAASLAH